MAAAGPEPGYLTAAMDAWDARTASWGGHLFRDRRVPTADDVLLLSNDYLTLARHPQVVAAQVAALAGRDTGATVFGEHPQRLLEAEFAEFLHAPAVVLCQSGWDANAGLLATLLAARRAQPVYLDRFAHASLWAGARGAGGVPRPFAHNRVDHLEQQIAQHGPGIVAVDTVYSVTGDLAPLAELADVCERTGSTLIADESHALGVHGPHGEGLAVALGVAERVGYRTASLAKAFAGRGGIITGSARMAAFLPYQSPNAIFSSTVLPHDIAGFRAALHVVRDDHERRERLWHNTSVLHDGLRGIGCDTRPSESPIIPLHTGGARDLWSLQCALDARGVFGAAFLPPATPNNRAVLRLTVNAGLTADDLDRVVRACAEAAPATSPARPGPHRTAMSA